MKWLVVVALFLVLPVAAAAGQQTERGDYYVGTGHPADSQIEEFLDTNPYFYHTHEVDRENPAGTYFDLVIVEFDQGNAGIKSFQDFVNEEYSVYAGVTISLPEFIPALDLRSEEQDTE